MGKVIPFPRKKQNDSNEKWILIVNTAVEYEAHLICGLLETKGIPYRLQSLKHMPHPVSGGQLGSYLIWVPEHWVKIAQKLIHHAPS